MVGLFVLFLSMAPVMPSVEREVYIMPAGYVGPVLVIYDVPNGEEAERNSEGATVFRIPPSGVLKLRSKSSGPGIVALRYYYEEADGTRSRIPAELGDKKVLQAFSSRDGLTGVINGHRLEKRWTSFIVGVPDSRNDWWEARYKQLDDAMLKLLPPAKGDSGTGGW